MQRVLLIGSGRRIQNNFVPALSCLKADFKIVGIHSKTPEHYQAVAQKFQITPIESIDDRILAQTDVVVISVPRYIWPSILLKLEKHAQRLTVIIDTPLNIPCINLLKKFKKIIITEDYFNFPQFELLREFCTVETIGNIKAVNLHHNGYRYHGTSLIRSFFDFKQALSITSKIHGSSVDLFLRFPNHATASMLEPYTGEGTIEISGEKASVSNDVKNSNAEYILKPIYTEAFITAFEINGNGKTARKELSYLPELIKQGATDNFQIQKMHGLITVFQSILKDNIYSKYNFYQALYDTLISEPLRITQATIFDPAGRYPSIFYSRVYWCYLQIASSLIKLKGRLFKK